METKSSQTEQALSSLTMYLYEAYVKEHKLSTEQAKTKVAEKLREELNKFNSKSNKKSSNKELLADIRLTLNMSKRTLTDAKVFNVLEKKIEKLIKDNNLE